MKGELRFLICNKHIKQELSYRYQFFYPSMLIKFCHNLGPFIHQQWSQSREFYWVRVNYIMALIVVLLQILVGEDVTVLASSESCCSELLFQNGADVFMVAIRYNRIIERILPSFLVEVWVHVSIIPAKDWSQKMVGMIEWINKGNRIRTDLTTHELQIVVRLEKTLIIEQEGKLRKLSVSPYLGIQRP